MNEQDTATITFRTYSASEAIPIEGAVIKIRNPYGELLYSILTDEDGITEILELPAPPRELSLEPETVDRSYSLYDIEISKIGYYTKEILNIPLYAGVPTELPINMIDVTDDNADQYPRGSINAIINGNGG